VPPRIVDGTMRPFRIVDDPVARVRLPALWRAPLRHDKFNPTRRVSAETHDQPRPTGR